MPAAFLAAAAFAAMLYYGAKPVVHKTGHGIKQSACVVFKHHKCPPKPKDDQGSWDSPPTAVWK